MDTITINTPRPINPSILKSLSTTSPHKPITPPPPEAADWTFSYSHNDSRTGTPTDTRRMTHKDTGLQITKTNQYNTRIQVSLPRLLYGNNNKLITTQSEIDRAMEKLWATVDEVLLAPEDSINRGMINRGWPYFLSRVDFAWTIAVPPSRLINILRNYKHPEIHNKTVEHDTSIEFKGSEMKIIAYDKQAEQTNNIQFDQGHTRVEIQWKSKQKLQRVLDVDPLEHLDFQTLYRAYRNTLLKLDGRQEIIDDLPYNKVNVVAWMIKNKLPAPGGEDPITWAMNNRNDKKNKGNSKLPGSSEKEVRRRFKKQVERTLIALDEFRFADYLPEFI